MVKVEPDELERVISDFAMDFFKVFAEAFLWAFFVDEIDKCAVFVVFFDIIVVFAGDFEVKFVIGVDGDFGIPLKIWILVPEERHGATKLYMWEDIFLTAVFSEENKLSFSSVGSVPIKITASGNPPFSLSSLVPSRYQSHFARIVHSCMREVYHDKPRDKTCNPLVSLHFHKLIHPITVVHVTQPLVLHWTICSDEFLQRVREVVLVAEVKVLCGEHFVQSLDVNFVLWGLFMAETEELHLLDLEYFPVVNLSDYRGFCYHYKVVIDFHFDDSIDSFNGYFLEWWIVYFDKVVWGDFGDFFAGLIWKQTELWDGYSSSE